MKRTRTENGAKELLARIEQTGFAAHYSMLGDGNVRQYDWEKMAPKLSGLEKGLWKFLLLGEAVSRKEAADLLGKNALDFLLRHKLCTVSSGKVSMGTLRLVRVWGMTFFLERGVATPAYLGDDTKTLLAMVPTLARGRCLSLYSAGGIEVMPLVAKATLNFALPKANPAILQANVELNSAQAGAVSASFGKNGGGSYDLIVSSPPCYIQGRSVKLPKHVAGGSDGLKCVRRVLEAAQKELVPDGQALMTFVFFAEMDSATMEQRLHATLDPYGLNYLVTVSSKLAMEPGAPVFNHLISSGNPRSAQEVEKLVHRTMAHIRRHKFGAAHLLTARLWKSGPGKPLDRQITNYSDTYYGSWTI